MSARGLKWVTGILTKLQIKRLIVALHTCIRNTMVAVEKCARISRAKSSRARGTAASTSPSTTSFGLHAKCNATAPQLSAICDDSIDFRWCNAHKVQTCTCEAHSTEDIPASVHRSCGADQDTSCAHCGAQRYLGKVLDIAREAVSKDGTVIDVYSVVSQLFQQRYSVEAIREWVGAHMGNWNEGINGANACSAWDKPRERLHGLAHAAAADVWHHVRQRQCRARDPHACGPNWDIYCARARHALPVDHASAAPRSHAPTRGTGEMPAFCKQHCNPDQARSIVTVHSVQAGCVLWFGIRFGSDQQPLEPQKSGGIAALACLWCEVGGLRCRVMCQCEAGT